MLRLHSNELNRLPDNFDHLKALTKLSVHDNRLEHPPQEICDQGIEPLFAHIAQERNIRVNTVLVSDPVW